eukprot:maker-scaffold319_size207808-snap-gene-0.27 protein:Tk00371 transcript:maker-scaffold319_size207808-snap-gene-0.27-mRNA-1 annotation:"hypothetical protein DAPPUDRAFT_308237"
MGKQSSCAGLEQQSSAWDDSTVKVGVRMELCANTPHIGKGLLKIRMATVLWIGAMNLVLKISLGHQSTSRHSNSIGSGTSPVVVSSASHLRLSLPRMAAWLGLGLWASVLFPGILALDPSVHILRDKGDIVLIPQSQFEGLEIFCHMGLPPSLAQFWSSSVMRLQITSDDFTLFVSKNATGVKELYDSHSWPYAALNTLPWKSKDMKLNPFERTCVGVLTKSNYQVYLQHYRVNYWQVVMSLAGIALFIYAPKLCRNVFFHYTTGIAAGVLLSLLVITFFIQRKIRTSWMGWILGVYSLSIYFLTTLWYNFRSYLIEHHLYVLGYFVVAGLTSFAVCYRMGPVENPRTLNLIQWSLQGFALILIYLSSYYQPASLSLALVFLTWASIPDVVKAKSQTWYRKKFFPPRVRLLKESEYMDQSRIETKKALEELRSFCRSPECNTWKLTRNLKSPTRFADFVEGSPHLTEEEVMDYSHADYDEELNVSLMTDDEDDLAGVPNGVEFMPETY